MPFRTVPVLEVSDKVPAQSIAISKYLAAKYGKKSFITIITLDLDI